MGREIKRVPVDFDHPIGTGWPGFINPYYEDEYECPKCQFEGECDCDDGYTIESKEARETWLEEEPPWGDGWQVWENVSEGSPISPVFASAELCAHWVAGKENTSIENARIFVEHGWAPSLVMVGDQLMTGIQAGNILYEEEAE